METHPYVPRGSRVSHTAPNLRTCAADDDRDKIVGQQKKDFYVTIPAKNGGKDCTEKAKTQACNKQACAGGKDADMDAATPPASSSSVRAAAGMMAAALAAAMLTVH